MTALPSRQQHRGAGDASGSAPGTSDEAAAADEKAGVLLHATARLVHEAQRSVSSGGGSNDAGAAVAAPPLEPSVDQLAGDQDSLLAACVPPPVAACAAHVATC